MVLAAVTLLAFIALAAGACPKFMVVAPNVFNVNEKVAISVLLRTARSSVTLSVRSRGSSNVHSTQRKPVQKDRQETFHLKVDENKPLHRGDNGNFYVQLRVEFGNCEKSQDILVNTRTGTVFVSTDKPIYLPKQTVHVTIFTLDEFRRGKTMPVRFEVEFGGVIMLRKDGESVNGFLAENYQLSKRASPGNWSIKASYGKDYSKSRTTYIEVRDYVLPHFEVQITKAPQQIETTGPLTVEFSARYSFDVQVEGHALIVFRLFPKRGDKVKGERRLTDLIRIEAKEKHTYLLDDIENLFEEEDGESFEKFVRDGARIQIDVHITEKSTGIRYTAHSPPIHFISSPHRISFDNTPVTFNPGQPFTVKMEVTGSGSGNPLQGLKLEVDVSNQNRGTVHTAIGVSDNDNGLYEFTFNVDSAVSKLNIHANVHGYNKTRGHSIPKAVMSEYMQLSMRADLLQPGRMTTLTASLTKGNSFEDSGMHYVLISGGRIFKTSKEDTIDNSQITATESIGYDMAPHIRIVAWYFTKNTDELIAFSMLNSVKKVCKTPTKISLVTKKVKPAESFNLRYDGPSNATLITYAVDKSVYFLSNRSRLTTKSFYEEFLTRDLGCAAGGGRTVTDVFRLAGLTIITDKDSMPRREGFGCSEGRTRRSTSPESTANSQAINESSCCEAGKRKTESLDIRNSRYAKQCLLGAKRHTFNVHCINAFASCCLKRMKELTSNEDGRHGSEAEAEAEDTDIPFITDEAESFPRNDFRESWDITSDEPIEEDGSVSRELTAPGTITTWVMQATTLSPEEGMCVAEPLDVVSKKDLFVKLHLPKSAIMGEQVEIKATVYNDGYSDQRVFVDFLGPDKGCSQVPVGKWKRVGPPKKMVNSKKSWTVTWLFVPMEAKDVEIKVKLISFVQFPDIVTRTLRVVPSGSLRIAPILTVTQQPDNATANGITNSAGALIYEGSRQNTKDGRQQTGQIHLQTPPEAIRGSEIMTAHFIGDIMAPIVEGMIHGMIQGTERLLRQPGGCGEQTMAVLGPTVFTAQYMSAKGRLVGANEVNAIKYINTGIDNMLTYRKSNGGFSVFRSTHATTWLTAFALKTFSQVRNSRLKIKAIDQYVIRTAAAWLMRQPRANGLFSSLGQLYHVNMVGGVTVGQTLTAYIWIAIIEAGYYKQHNTTIDSSLTILANSATIKTPSYTLALITLALAKANHPRATRVNEFLLEKAQYVPNMIPEQRYWPNGNAQQYGNQEETEATCYGLLAQMALSRLVPENNAIVEWLLRQRYGSNIFRTTQTTVVCLEALAKYKTITITVEDDIKMKCSVFDASRNKLKSTIVLNNANRLVQQKMDLTKQIGQRIDIMCEGIGRADTTIETSYYVSRSNETATAFELTAEAKQKVPGKKENMGITVCAKLKDQDLKMLMPMLEIGIGSGYSPVESTLKTLKENPTQTKVDFYEINDRSVVLYMSEISSAKLQCVDFEVTQDNVVEDLRPVPVRAYAYYNPDEIESTIFYDPLGKNSTAKLDVQCKDDGICKCLEHICPTCYGYETKMKDPIFNTSEKLTNYACLWRGSRRIHFVFKTQLKEVIIEDGEYKYTMLILKVAKHGLERKEDLEGMTRVFKMPMKCNPCDYVKDGRYIIMGEDPERTNSIQTDIDYYLTPDTYFVPIVPKGPRAKALTTDQRIINRINKKFINNMDGCST